MFKRSAFRTTLLALAITWLASCSSAPTRPSSRLVEIPPGSQAAQVLQLWLSGDEASAQLQAEGATAPEAAFFAAEIDYWRGDVEGAFDAYGTFLAEHPAHPFARYAAARFHTLRNSVVDFERRAQSYLERIDRRRLEPLTRVYLAMAEQAATFRIWNDSDSTAPFDGASVGNPDHWLATPNLSPWRLQDIDTEFTPEREKHLGSAYLSPALAVDTAENYIDAEPYFPGGISFNFRPDGGDGIYYLETFVEVAGTEPRDFWLFGSFSGASRVWIDGEEAMRRDEGDYSSGKLMRKVRLPAGRHRLLLKLGYQRGYRDWFDLMFVPDGAKSLSEGGLNFRTACVESRVIPDCVEAPSSDAQVEFLTAAKKTLDFEPVYITAEEIGRASDTALYLAMLSAHFSAESEAFDLAWAELQERRPDFAAGWALQSTQVQTLWQVPARLRDANSLQSIRAALERDPDSVLFLSELGARLKDQGKDREIREILESAREKATIETDGARTLLNAGPLTAWANYLAGQGWDEAAEKVWRELLELAPAHCTAARRVQTLEQGRSIYREPREITDAWKSCPDLWEVWVTGRDDKLDESLALYEKFALRFPLRSETQRRFAIELAKRGRDKDAEHVVDEALKRMPAASTLWNWKIDRALAEKGVKAALALLDDATEVLGEEGWILWKRGSLLGEVPLADIMPDGHAAAMEAVARSQDSSLSNDDAYYVVDFAARQYYPSGASMTLTHTVVRVMTKSAIDRYGETNVPANARLLLARTIKQDGTTRIPETTAGKSTLSMPGLAEGDFVEMAYVQYASPRTPHSERQGVRFYFRMGDISTIHSEYVILGDVAEFILENDPPNAEPIVHNGIKGVRFLAKDNPRPRAEPRSVGLDEYLPWIQMYREGLVIDDIETARRTTAEQIRDSLKQSNEFAAQASAWTRPDDEGMTPGSEAHVKAIFYKVAGHFPEPSPGAFGTDVSHAIQTQEGSAHLVLKAVYDRAGIPADIYLARTSYARPTPLPIGEFGEFSTPVVRVTVPETGEVRWVSPDGPDATFNAMGPAVQGQSAICVTCDSMVKDTVPSEGLVDNTQYVDVKSKLDASGVLNGTIRLELPGVAGFSIRQALRSRTDDTSREKLMGAFAAGIVAGSELLGYTLENESNPDEALGIEITFRRPDFARTSGIGGWQIETRLFHEAVAQYYAALPDRTIPILIPSPREAKNSFTIEFPAKPTIQGATGETLVTSEFGAFTRETVVDGNSVTIRQDSSLPIQRIYPSDYLDFQKWAVEVEQLSNVYITF